MVEGDSSMRLTQEEVDKAHEIISYELFRDWIEREFYMDYKAAVLNALGIDTGEMSQVLCPGDCEEVA